MLKRHAAPLLALALATLVGCTGIRLDKVDVTRLDASLPQGGRALLPGGASPLIVVATTADGRQLTTKGAGRGQLRWDNFEIEATAARVSTKGVVRVPEDPRESGGRTPRVRISVKGRPETAAEVDVPVRYDGHFVADFSGDDGSSGFSGSDGGPGSPGMPGSIDPQNPQAGGNGSDGSDGGSGGSGGNGEAGEPVRVWVALQEGPRPLLQVRVAGVRHDRAFLVDPDGGSLLVKTDGGRGGPGGRGGQGGSGGAGGSGSPDGSRGRDGSNGHDGMHGHGGAGGSITVFVDPEAEPFMSALQFSNRGGRRGKEGPPPEFHVQAVAALW